MKGKQRTERGGKNHNDMRENPPDVDLPLFFFYVFLNRHINRELLFTFLFFSVYFLYCLNLIPNPEGIQYLPYKEPTRSLLLEHIKYAAVEKSSAQPPHKNPPHPHIKIPLLTTRDSDEQMYIYT